MIREAIQKLIGIPSASGPTTIEIVRVNGISSTTVSWQTGKHFYMYRCNDDPKNIAKIKNRISGDASLGKFDFEQATWAKECFDGGSDEE